MKMLGWMHWTVPSAVGVLGLITVIVGLNIVDIYKPGYARKGFLPIPTTRGDRVFISVLSTVIVWFLWLKFVPGESVALSLCIVVPLVFVIMRWG